MGDKFTDVYLNLMTVEHPLVGTLIRAGDGIGAVARFRDERSQYCRAISTDSTYFHPPNVHFKRKRGSSPID